MTGKQWVRQSHRSISIAFMVAAGAIFRRLVLDTRRRNASTTSFCLPPHCWR